MCSLLFLSLLVVSAPKGQSGRRLYSLSRSFEFCKQKRLMAVFASQPDNQTPVYWISLMDGNSAQLAALWSELKYHNSYWLDAVTFRRDIHGPQKMNPNYFSSSATMRLTFLFFREMSQVLHGMDDHIIWYGYSWCPDDEPSWLYVKMSVCPVIFCCVTKSLQNEWHSHQPQLCILCKS